MNLAAGILIASMLWSAGPNVDRIAQAGGSTGVTPAPQTALSQQTSASAPLHYIYLIRHGHYDRDEAADDRVANGLNAVGREQARLVAERLAALPAPPARLVSSDYTRARETADVAGTRLGMAVARDTLLRECRPHSMRQDLMEGQQETELAACDAALEAAFARYFTPTPERETRDVLVCHGNVIRWLVLKAVGADPRVWASMDIANASLTVVAVRSDGTMRLVAFSDTGHLPRDRQTWVGRGPGW